VTAVQIFKKRFPARPLRVADGLLRVGGRECDLNQGLCPVTDLRAALAREAVLLRERDELIEQQATLSRESDHRLLNNLQMVSSLLSMQSRTSANAETASALTLAANRVATIGRIHRHLHSNDGVNRVAFKSFLEELGADFTAMLSMDVGLPHDIAVEGIDLELPTSIAIPLGFVVNELITNAVKYGEGAIRIRLARDSLKGFALSVENDGPALPKTFDPAASKGLGMRIIRSFVAKIGGELRIERGADGAGARFTVLFSAS
jgi:two-component sensor histidine kinase